ncbi:hypothetical protein EDD18DRAFT_1366668 [Armillaria luteobubalina]|uniref:Uncharacterized protein n=1 Tax=Armillaria luteobubalina TaxID=153913 RepID=A0AA39P2J9_9AGAR|nr:hypothetical protein EDD18DRAFT_1366666 [Armillaria luteobubalina]KAK0476001.1 hypothetical protein EDD18DRAFT_1366668 [Armillaria luteobubalina]
MDTQTLQLQETWAQPFLPTYRSVLCHGKQSLDTYLHGLFVAYHDCFWCSLGVPENPEDLNSVHVWKHSALTALAHLMLRVHTNHSAPISQSLPPVLPKAQSDTPVHCPQDVQQSIATLRLNNIPERNTRAAASSLDPSSNSSATDDLVGEAPTAPCSSFSAQVTDKQTSKPQCTWKVSVKSSVLSEQSQSSSLDSSEEELPLRTGITLLPRK